MKQLLGLYEDILKNGVDKGDRTGTGTRSVFGRQMRFDLSKGFPLATTKKVFFKGVVHELLWMLSGDTNIKYLTDNGVHIWDEWADEGGYLGPVYGKQWKMWSSDDWWTIDQIYRVIDSIRNRPDSRRHLVSAWNVIDLPEETDSPKMNVYRGYMALAPCHYSFQFYVANGKLSTLFNMRSSDAFLGLPMNIAFYALLTHMVAQQCNLDVGELIYSGADVHIYNNHFEQVNIQLRRHPRELPELAIYGKPDSIFDYKYDDFELVGYNPYPAIKGEVSV